MFYASFFLKKKDILMINNKVINLNTYKIYKNYLKSIKDGYYKLYFHSDKVIRNYPEEIKEYMIKNNAKEINKTVDKILGLNKYEKEKL